jgi:hypothetical protein
MRTKDAEQVLELLNVPVCLNLRLDELRILVTCLRAIAYQSEADDEPYLDEDGHALKLKLEQLYRLKLGELQGSRIAG